MYVIVVGAGKIGFYLTRELLSASHEVTLIERDTRVSATAAEELGAILITSDGPNPPCSAKPGQNAVTSSSPQPARTRRTSPRAR